MSFEKWMPACGLAGISTAWLLSEVEVQKQRTNPNSYRGRRSIAVPLIKLLPYPAQLRGKGKFKIQIPYSFVCFPGGIKNSIGFLRKYRLMAFNTLRIRETCKLRERTAT